MGGEELVGIADLADDRRHCGGHRRRPRLVQQRTELADDRAWHAVAVDDQAAAFDLELSVDEHQDGRHRVA